MGFFVFPAGSVLQFDYLNHAGKQSTRTIRFEGMDYGDNEWYPERQWFMRGEDLERNVKRSFALNRIDGNAITVVSIPAPKPINNDIAVQVAEEAFRAGYAACEQASRWGDADSAWDDFEPSEAIKELVE